jgi:Fe2+ transport system protein FeoA
MRLDELPPHVGAVVTRLEAHGAERRRLMDLGVLPGTEIVADVISPLGDPTAYLIRGALVALRRTQARRIHIATPEER